MSTNFVWDKSFGNFYVYKCGNGVVGSRVDFDNLANDEYDYYCGDISHGLSVVKLSKSFYRRIS